MNRFNLRKKPRISYYEPDETDLDEYVFCTECADFVYEYCAIHGALLVVPDDKVPTRPNFPAYVPRAALTIPRVFLHLARSHIPGAGLGVFATLTLPVGVRFGPFCGEKTQNTDSKYGWQIFDKNRKPLHVIDAYDANRSNWMRYVNCARHWCEQNLVAFQYRGKLYYRTIKIIPRFTELLVFYGREYANSLYIDLRTYNAPISLAQKLGASILQKTLKKLKTKEIKETMLEKQLNVHYSNKQSCVIKDRNPKEDNEETNVLVSKTDKTFKNNNYFIVPSITNSKKQELSTASDAESGIEIRNNDYKLHGIDTNSDIDSNNNNVALFSTTEIKHCETGVSLPFICKECNFQCSNEDILDKHSHIHKMNISCAFCSCKFLLESHYERHIIERHGNTTKSNNFNRSNAFVRTNDEICYPEDKGLIAKANVEVKPGQHVKIPHICHENLNKRNSIEDICYTEKPHGCQYCDKTFSRNSHLKQHIKIHTGEKPYECKYCDKRFAGGSALKRHIRIHTGEKPFECKFCNVRFAGGSALKRHIRIHTGEKPFECKFCNVRFAGGSALKRHIRIHTGEKPFECKFCNVRFAGGSALKRHIRIHTGEKPFECKFCNVRFAGGSALKRHIRIHTGEKPYKCNYCDVRFSESGTLKSHIRIHTGEKPYECKFCNVRFAGGSTLKRHIRIHTGEKPYECKFCNIRFAGSSSLKRHIRIHTGEKPYECKFCNIRFASGSDLKRHIKIHTAEKPYECKYCDKRFLEGSGLKRHIRIHTGEKPYKCNYCDVRFSEGGTLKSHIRIHTGEKPYKCNYCDVRFSEGGTLKSHIRIHTGEKPYKCNYCDVRFSKGSNLKSHIRIHTGEKPYECKFCNIGFAGRGSLKRHIKTHTGENTHASIL